MEADDRIVNSEGAPFGPILVKTLRAEVEEIDNPLGFDDRCRIAVVLAQAADYIEAVVEGKGPDTARIARLEAALRKWQEWSASCPPRECDDGSGYYSLADHEQAECEATARAALEVKP